MARRRGRGHRRGGFKIPIISLGILGGQIGISWLGSGGDFLGTLNGFQSLYTGFDLRTRSFVPQNLVAGYVPWLAKRFLLPIARPRLGNMKLPVSIS